MTKTFQTIDPSGKTRTIKSSRVINYAAFFKAPDGSYAVRFCKTIDNARAVWGVNKTIVGKAWSI